MVVMPKFVPRRRKQKHRQKEQTSTALVDTNFSEIPAPANNEKETRKNSLREELKSQNPKASSKKQKRLEKYIDNKLKKEENLELLKRLAQAKVDTTTLQSSKNLGRGNTQYQQKWSSNKITSDAASLSSNLSGDETDEDDLKLKTPGSEDKAGAREQPAVRLPCAGSGLKRPLEVGADGFPILKMRKRARRAKEQLTEELPWEGFDSDDEIQSSHQEDELQSNAESDTSQDNSEGKDSCSGSDNSLVDEDEGNDEDEDTESAFKIRSRQSAFKTWAKQQINDAIGFQPTPGLVELEDHPFVSPRKLVVNTVEAEEPLPLELQITRGNPDRKAFSIQIDRPEEVQNARLGLPVVGEEQKIMEAIHNNAAVVIWGATGSGKTTQIPQFLFEAGYGSPDSPNPGMIGVTQPRRVAAVSMARRVADELGQFSNRVAYQIRFESSTSKDTAVKFMTDGILLREITEDFSLSKYSVIVIDEAHERSVNTDILIGMVCRIVSLREDMSRENPLSVKPLKLVIMSATLRISDFTQNPNLFRQGPPPLVQAEGRQYPVILHFAKRTHRDYVEEAFRKVSKGHRKLPPGGMLVFLTGQGEIRDLTRRLKQVFKPTQREAFPGKVRISASDAPLEAEDLDLGGDMSVIDNTEDEGSDIEITGLDDDDEGFDLGEEAMNSSSRVHILPLYSQLPTKEQLRVFETPPEGSRLIVLATNVAETSLTIPGIKYVFDCGRAKEKQYDLLTGVQSFQVGWISKASASQRAGRAGRTGPGHCYRLYSSAVYEGQFPEYTDPEILRTPIEGVVLQMKSMGLHNVINFPFPTPPSHDGLTKAERLLKNLGALSLSGQVTQVGHRLSTYPLSPRFGKMLYIGHQHGCMPYVIALVAALAVGDLFIPENQIQPTLATGKGGEVYTNSDRLEETALEQRHKDYERVHRIFGKHDDTSDALKYLSSICAYAYASDGDAFCEQMFLRAKAFKEAAQLRSQLTEIVRSNNPGVAGPYEARLPEPSDKQLKALKQIVTAGFIDNVAIRADLSPDPPEMPRAPKRAIDVPYLTLFKSREGRVANLSEKAVYVHPSSILARLSSKEMPQYVIYSHLQQSSASVISEQAPKVRMHPLVAPSGLQLSAIAHGTPLLEYGKPIGKVDLLDGIPQRRACWVIPLLVSEPGSLGWPLPAKKAIQRKDAKEGWIVEKLL